MQKTLIVGLLVGWTSLALAQPDAGEPQPPPDPNADPNAGMAAPPPPPPPMGSPVPQPPVDPNAPPPSTVPKGVLEDANAGRSWIAPTALTEPKGTFTFSDFELLLISGTYAVTDQISIGLTTLLPIIEDMPTFGAFNLKAQVFKSDRLYIAAQGVLMGGLVRDTRTTFDMMGNVTGEETESTGTGLLVLGGAATYCIDIDCYSTVSGYLGAGFIREEQSAVPFLLSVNTAIRVGKNVKLIGELDTGLLLGDVDAVADGGLLWYGVRFTSPSIGVDLGFAKPVAFEGDQPDTGLPLGLPFVSFSYRVL